MDSQWSKQEACFECATQVWLAVNHSDFIWPFLRPYMGVIPNPKMAFIFPISCISALIFPIFVKYFPKYEGKGSFPKSQIKSLNHNTSVTSGEWIWCLKRTGPFLPISRGRISAPFPIKNSHLFSQYHVWFSQLRKVKTFFFFLLFLKTTTTYEKHWPISDWYLNAWHSACYPCNVLCC